jgi:hypothetical protein
MLRSNRATRPFYNERLIHWLLGAAALVVILATVFNVSEYLRLSGRQGGLAADAARDEAMARTLAARAAEARRRIDPKGLQRVSDQALEANGIIDARTFSWTALFDDIEATLPPTVMLTSITPSVGADGAQVRFTVVGKTVDAIDTFVERLESTKRFSDLQPTTENVTEDGNFQTSITGHYLNTGGAASAPAGSGAPTRPGTITPTAGAPGRKGAR